MDPILKNCLTGLAILLTKDLNNIAAIGLEHRRSDINISFPTILVATNYGFTLETRQAAERYLQLFQRYCRDRLVRYLKTDNFPSVSQFQKAVDNLRERLSYHLHQNNFSATTTASHGGDIIRGHEISLPTLWLKRRRIASRNKNKVDSYTLDELAKMVLCAWKFQRDFGMVIPWQKNEIQVFGGGSRGVTTIPVAFHGDTRAHKYTSGSWLKLIERLARYKQALVAVEQFVVAPKCTEIIVGQIMSNT
ncbi:hypothetical protein B0H63DRAFT_551461 [Podospora didyma]|uniref:Uncharacterized protein n=1 Tax=Podospora didyma TaxID=330526 RepID=A0AAE0KAQ3_9PEZI|nr:hypothetical protein B0H63DRAFT_551461 [Podospora didyma]